MKIQSIKQINALTTGTTTLTSDFGSNDAKYLLYKLVGTGVTLTGNYNITLSTTTSILKGTTFTLINNATFNLSGNHVYILGTQIPDELVNKVYISNSIYDGTSWITVIMPSFTEEGIIGSKKYVSQSVDANALGALSVYTEALQAKAVTAAKIADNTITATQIAAGTITATEIANTTITEAKIANQTVTLGKLATQANDTYLSNISGSTASPVANTKADVLRNLGLSGVSNQYYTEIIIPTASVLTANATPYTLIAAPGASLGIEVISVNGTMTLPGVAYATNGISDIIIDTATVPQFSKPANGFLFGTVARTIKFDEYSTALGTTDTQIIANKALMFKVRTGNPTAGTTDIKIGVLYRIINI